MAAGTLDTTFGTNSGWTPGNFYYTYDSIGDSLAIDSIGRIILTGYTKDNSGISKLLVARYTSNGLLDTSFGEEGGFTATNFYSSKNSEGAGLVIDSSGNIVVTGYTVDDSDILRLLVARYTSSGILDTSFGGGNGFIVGNFYAGKISIGFDLAIDSSGYIVVTGRTDDTNNLQKLLVVRYTNNGVLDTSFGEGGAGWTASNFYLNKNSYANELAIDSSGRIVVTGSTRNNVNLEILLIARYTINGLLDNNFGEGGLGWTASIFFPGKISNGYGLSIDSSGFIVVTGGTRDNINLSRLLIARYTSSGLLDNSNNFGEGGLGWTATNFYLNKTSRGSSLSIDSSGNIVVAGRTVDNNNVQILLIVRYTSTGLLDTNFGEGGLGWTATNFYINKSSSGYSLSIDSSGHILVSGYAMDESDVSRLILARYIGDEVHTTTTTTTTTSTTTPPTTITTSTTITTTLPPTTITTSTTITTTLPPTTTTTTTSTTTLLPTTTTTTSTTTLLPTTTSTTTSTTTLLPTTTTTTTEPICVPAGTPILTDQGVVAIENIQPLTHTINKSRIVAITNTITPEKVLVVFEANSMGINNPSKRTTMTPGHEVLYKGKLVQAKNFVGRVEGVHNVPYTGEVLYNVLMERHGLMRVNNMVLETLHPENKVAKEILGKL